MDRSARLTGVGPTTFFSPAKTFLLLVVLTLVAWSALGTAPVSSAEQKTFTAAFESTGNANVKVTLTNTAPQQQLGSVNVTPPGNVKIVSTGQPSPRGTATVKNNVLELRNLAIPPGGTATVTFATDPACPTGQWKVEGKQANNFSGPPGNNFTLTASSSILEVECAVAVRFVEGRHPADAVKNTHISSEPFRPAGDPIQVEVIDAAGTRVTSSTATIALAIYDDPNPSPGATLSGMTTRQAQNGVATFTKPSNSGDDLRIDLNGIGYTLEASSPGLISDTSDEFRILDQATECQADVLCKAQLEADDQSMKVELETISTTSGFLLLAIGAADIDCGDDGNHSPHTVTIDQIGLDGIKTIVVTIPRHIDQQQTNNGVAFYEVCYESPHKFLDKDGNLVNKGLLPDCPAPTPAPPCVFSKTKTSGGDVKITGKLPAVDPNWR